jgi:hypothetical protein
MFFILLILKYDSFTSIILLILIIAPFKSAIKEFFLSDTAPTNNLSIATDLLGKDTRFKVDDVANDTVLRQIKSQIEFDPYKTNLAKGVVFEIYNKYFNNDIFTKLMNTNDDSKQYIAAGNFNYLPKNDKIDYDIVSYQNLSQNTQIGINPISDGISNNTKINRNK